MAPGTQESVSRNQNNTQQQQSPHQFYSFKMARYYPYKSRRLQDYLLNRNLVTYGNASPLAGLARNHPPFLQRLNLMKKLPVHDGCVNTICWNKTGEYILSGSDDCNLCITKPACMFDQGKDYNVLYKIQTRHLGNIFSAKFIPNSADTQLVSCSSDGPVIVHDINSSDPTQGYLTYNCHSSTVFTVATVPDDDNVFLSCGEDHTVRLFDMRCHRSCHRTSTCPHRYLIKNSDAISTLSIHPLNTNLLLVGRGDGVGLVYDRRRLPDVTNFSREQAHQERLAALEGGYKPPDNSKFTGYLHPLEGVVGKFCVPDMEEKNRFTSLSYSANGSEVLASYSGDYVYLFNHDTSSNFELIQTLPKKCQSPQEAAESQGRGNNNNNNNENNCDDRTNNGGNSSNRTLSDRNRRNEQSRRMPRIRVRGDWSDTGVNSVPESARSHSPSPHAQFLQRMAEVAFTLSAARSSNTQRFYFNASNEMNLPASNESSNTAPSDDQQTIDEEDEDEEVDDEEVEEEDENRLYDDVEIIIDSDNNNHRDVDSNDSSNNPTRESEDPRGRRKSRSEGDREAAATNSHQRSRVSEETKAKFKRTFADLKQKYNRIPTYSPRVKYQGHRNCRTSIKQATFWGDDYIMSGSDCGRIMIWEKQTAKLKMAFPADERVVNCLAPNPHYFALASSGIDYDIKLWSTQGLVEGPLQMSESQMENIMKINEEMLEESKQTICVPPHLFFRVIASLARDP